MRSIRIKLRTWAIATAVLVVGAFVVLRRVGIPKPEVIEMATIQGRLVDLGGRTFGWRESSFYSNGKIKGRVFCRGEYIRPRLVSGKFYDPDGNLRSRVVDGNGFAIIFHDNGNPLALAGYLKGVMCGPYFVWNSEGQLLRAEYLDRTGRVIRSYTNIKGAVQILGDRQAVGNSAGAGGQVAGQVSGDDLPPTNPQHTD